jgi:hypothetical protein
MPTHQAPAWLSYVLPLVIVAVVMTLRMFRMRGARPLRLERLWVLPAIYAVIVGLTFLSAPPGAMGWLWSLLALAIGAGIGWYRGSMMRISVDPETHALSQQASPASFLILIVLVLLKMGTRAEFDAGSPGHGVSLATDTAMAFALGLIGATRVEMAIRGNRLLAKARAGAAGWTQNHPG